MRVLKGCSSRQNARLSGSSIAREDNGEDGRAEPVRDTQSDRNIPGGPGLHQIKRIVGR